VSAYDDARTKVDAMTPAEKEALHANAKAQGLMGIAAVSAVGFVVLGPIGLIAAPAALIGLAMLMGNRN
jgi:hypothetical protein